MIPLLLRPQWLSFKCSTRRILSSPQGIIRSLVLSAFAFGVMYAIFRGTLKLVVALQSEARFAWIPPSIPLGLFFLFIMVMILLSACVTSVGALFHARDLDLILSTPIHPLRFFFHTLLEVMLSSSWLVIAFGVPVLLGFGVAYHAGYEYVLMSAAVFLPYLVIPSALALLIATLLSALVPMTRTRELFGIILILSVAGLFFLFRLLIPNSSALPDVNAMLRMVSILLVPHGSLSPSFWASSAIAAALGEKSINPGLFLGLLYSASLAIISISYLVVTLGHKFAYSRSKAHKVGSRAVGSGLISVVQYLPLRPETRAMLKKEYCSFMRDMTQAAQFIVLLGICVLYLYNLQILRTVQGLSEELRAWWNGFLTVSNLSLGAFVMCAFCTRFVFPSLSLEGQSVWILESSPLSVRDILRLKFKIWILPVIIVSSVIFTAGAFAIDAPLESILLHILASIILSFGVTGLAIGLGAYFANFEWEHPSQLAASFGALVFMLVSLFLIALNMLLPSLLVFLYTAKRFGPGLSNAHWFVAIGLSVLLMAYFNFFAARWAIGVGGRELERRAGRV